MTLQERFNRITLEYLEAFLRKHGFYDDETGEYCDYYWIGDDVGGVVDVADYCIPFDDIRYDIDNGVPKGTYESYYECAADHGFSFNFRSYATGYRPEEEPSLGQNDSER